MHPYDLVAIPTTCTRRWSGGAATIRTMAATRASRGKTVGATLQLQLQLEFLEVPVSPAGCPGVAMVRSPSS